MSTAVAQRAETPAAEMTHAQKQRHRLDQFMGAIEKRQDQIGTLLADSGIDPRLFLEGCRRSLMRDPDLIGVEPASFIQAALNCASDGLVPDGRKAAIVKFKGAAQYMPMYQGLLDVAYRSHQFKSIEAHVVYQGDEFDYDMGDAPFIRHKRPLESTSTKIIGAYCIAKTINGGVFREVMGSADLAKVRAVSRATKGPNIDWPGEMARKAPLRRLWKFLPKTPAMDRVAIHDDATYDHSALSAANEPTRSLRPGFNPPAITHQPAEDISPEAPQAAMDAILDGDFVPAFDGEREAEIIEADLPGHADEPEDEGFPGDRQSEADAFDVQGWARDLIASDTQLQTVAEIEDFFADKEATRRYRALEAAAPVLAKTLVSALNGRKKALQSKAAG